LGRQELLARRHATGQLGIGRLGLIVPMQAGDALLHSRIEVAAGLGDLIGGVEAARRADVLAVAALLQMRAALGSRESLVGRYVADRGDRGRAIRGALLAPGRLLRGRRDRLLGRATWRQIVPDTARCGARLWQTLLDGAREPAARIGGGKRARL